MMLDFRDLTLAHFREGHRFSDKPSSLKKLVPVDLGLRGCAPEAGRGGPHDAPRVYGILSLLMVCVPCLCRLELGTWMASRQTQRKRRKRRTVTA